MSSHDIKKAIEAEFGPCESKILCSDGQVRVMEFNNGSQIILAAARHGKKTATIYTFFANVGEED